MFKGEKAYFNENDELTVFGQAFSHCIANYACQESLEEIMARVSFKHFHIHINLIEIIFVFFNIN